jgi:hypothetical protein
MAAPAVWQPVDPFAFEEPTRLPSKPRGGALPIVFVLIGLGLASVVVGVIVILVSRHRAIDGQVTIQLGRSQLDQDAMLGMYEVSLRKIREMMFLRDEAKTYVDNPGLGTLPDLKRMQTKLAEIDKQRQGLDEESLKKYGCVTSELPSKMDKEHAKRAKVMVEVWLKDEPGQRTKP